MKLSVTIATLTAHGDSWSPKRAVIVASPDAWATTRPLPPTVATPASLVP